MKQGRIIECPGCLLRLPDRHLNPDDRFNASGECRQVYYEITYYTLSKNDSCFIHQHVVDAYAAQNMERGRVLLLPYLPLSGFTLQQRKDIPGNRCSRHI
jgi:hypothetical protein